MTEQRPGAPDPPAGTPDPTLVEGGDASTVASPGRWSGAAAVPPRPPRQRWWATSRRLPPPPAEPVDWATMPAVDPWADQDTPVDPFPAVPDPPVTQLPPTRLESPAPTPPAPPAVPPAMPPPVPPAVPPAMPPAARPPKLSRRQRRAMNRPPAPARPPVQSRPALPEPPPWVPREVRRPLPPAPRRRRRWGRRFALLSLFGLLCCCGGPVAWFQFPAARQYPVRADLPRSFADLTRRDDRASTRTASRLADQLRAVDPRVDDVFHGVYVDDRGKRVTLFGVTGWRFTPGRDVDAQLDRLADDFRLSGVQAFDLGEFGAHERCGVGRQGGTPVVVCAWADHGSLAAVLLTRRSLDDSADLVSRLRGAVLSPA
jgi:hypothetical protein